MSLANRLARLEDAYAVGVDYSTWPLGEQILILVGVVRERLYEGVRGTYYATDRELAVLAAASRCARQHDEHRRDGAGCIECVRKRLAEAGDQDPSTLVEDDVLPHIQRFFERLDRVKQPSRERELFEQRERELYRLSPELLISA